MVMTLLAPLTMTPRDLLQVLDRLQARPME